MVTFLESVLSVSNRIGCPSLVLDILKGLSKLLLEEVRNGCGMGRLFGTAEGSSGQGGLRTPTTGTGSGRHRLTSNQGLTASGADIFRGVETR